VLGGLAAACGLRGAAVLAAGRPASAVNFEIPRGACDCHTHVFGDPQRFPMWAGRAYTPEPASARQLMAMHRALGIDRTVIVTPSIYGADNACTLDALRIMGANARAVALIDDHISNAELDHLDRAGARGIRLNFETLGVSDPAVVREKFQRAAKQIAGRNWHLQIYTRLTVIDALHDTLMATPCTVVFDHFAEAQAALGVGQPGFDGLLSLMRAGKAYTKLSAAYRISTQAPDYLDVAPLARALVAANPQRALWASDWPHPNSSPPPGHTAADVTPLYRIDDGRLLNQLAVWIPDAGTRKLILVDNPARLYGF
jgi:predicted TIM-barrel fold metal-dependent hydrolase